MQNLTLGAIFVLVLKVLFILLLINVIAWIVGRVFFFVLKMIMARVEQKSAANI